jgi:hypothetical protein
MIEIAAYVNALLTEELERAGMSQYTSLVLEHTKQSLARSADVQAYGLSDTVNLEWLNGKCYETLLIHENKLIRERLMQLLDDFFMVCFINSVLACPTC